MKTYSLAILFLLIVSSISHENSFISPKIAEILHRKNIQTHQQLAKPIDDLHFLEPATVPDPEDNGRWWYAPSPRAALYAHKNRRFVKNDQVTRANEYLRLPADLAPVIYNIRLVPFIEEGNFTTDGHVDIFFDCLKNTSSININSAEIEVDASSITVEHIATNSLLDIEEFIDDQINREMIEIRTKVLLVEGNRYKISMNFISYLNDQLRGFYRSSYLENGVRKWLAVTQMESTDARRAFPCFDEPSMKAEFSVALGRKKTMSSASNMLLLATYPMNDHPDYVWDHYQSSVKMSTYLVAFLVSEFAAVPAASGHRVPFRMWVKQESKHLAEHSLKIGPAMQEFYEDYFKIPYPLPKQDLAAIPDFSAGAMENWGLITYRETRLLIDLEKDPRSLRQSIAAINAHEIAHQWFGNLVTTSWWNTIWLNEGFATYVEFLGTEAVEPGLRYMDQFVNIELHYVFGIDGLETSRPINLNVTTPSEIDRMFDGISYDKGACIIRMCASFIGLETFNRGLTRYLTARAYKPAVEDDLWHALQEQINEEDVKLPASVKEIMDTWTLQMGFPLVTVMRDYAAGSAEVHQNRFLLRKSSNSNDDHLYQWWIPLTFHSPSNTTEKSHWISNTQDSTTIENLQASANEWVIFNVDQKNVYRVAYDEKNYELIKMQLLADHEIILDNNRAQLLDDAFVLASVDAIPYKSALDLSLYLKKEVEWAPWNAVLGELNYIDIMVYTVPLHIEWKNYLTELVLPYYNSVGFEESPSDAHLTIYSRSDAINWACRLGIRDCVTHVKESFAALMLDPSNQSLLSPNQKSLILNYGVELGGEVEWTFAFEQYYSMGDGSFLVPMTKTRQINLIYQQLEWMLNDTVIRRGDVRTLFSNIASNPAGNSIATNFLINRWSDIEAALGNAYFADFFRYLCDRKNTQDQLDELIKLRNDHADLLGASNTVQQGIEIVQSNINWMKSNLEEISIWLDGLTTEPPTSTAQQQTTTQGPSTTSSTTSRTSSATLSTTSTQTSMTTPSSGYCFNYDTNLMIFTGLLAIFKSLLSYN